MPLTSGIARILDVPERAQFVAVAADVSEEGDDGLADIEARLRSLAIRSAWRRRNERQFGIVVLDGDAHAASERLAEIVALPFEESDRVQPVLRRPRRHRGVRRRWPMSRVPRSIRAKSA